VKVRYRYIPAAHHPLDALRVALLPIAVFLVVTLGEKLSRRKVIRLKRIYNFYCSMLFYTQFALCFVTLRGVFMHFIELTY
jgi:hypothetical protein